MEYKLYGRFITDGDYHIDMGEDNTIWWNKDLEEYSIYLNSENVYTIRDFLEELMVSFRVSFTHHYLVPMLYEMVEKIYDELFDDDEVFSTSRLGGNYEGTSLILVKLRYGERTMDGE